MAAYRSHPILLGSGISRILCPGTGKQDWICRKRRSVQSDAAKNHSGGHFSHCIYRACYSDVQRSKPAVESFCSIFLPDSGCFLRIFEIKAHFSKKSEEKFGSKEKMRTFAIPNDKNSITVGSYNG